MRAALPLDIDLLQGTLLLMAMDLEGTRSEVVVDKLEQEDRMLLATDMDRMLGGVLDQLQIVMGKLLEMALGRF